MERKAIAYKDSPVTDAEQLEAVMRYHERTKHHFNRFAPGPGRLDWANQPDPFRRYAEAPLTRLPILKADQEPRSPAYESLYAPDAVRDSAQRRDGPAVGQVPLGRHKGAYLSD